MRVKSPTVFKETVFPPVLGPVIINRLNSSPREIRCVYETGYEKYTESQISRMTHIEAFSINVGKYIQEGKTEYDRQYILFDYQIRDPLTYEACAYVIEENRI